MIHRQQVQFVFKDTFFKATVIYSDAMFRMARRGEQAFWKVKMYEPQKENFCGEVRKIHNWLSAWLSSTQEGERYFVFDKTVINPDDKRKINIYPKVIRKMLYEYFNKETVAIYRKKVDRFNTMLDRKYATRLDTLEDKKHAS